MLSLPKSPSLYLQHVLNTATNSPASWTIASYSRNTWLSSPAPAPLPAASLWCWGGLRILLTSLSLILGPSTRLYFNDTEPNPSRQWGWFLGPVPFSLPSATWIFAVVEWMLFLLSVSPLICLLCGIYRAINTSGIFILCVVAVKPFGDVVCGVMVP